MPVHFLSLTLAGITQVEYSAPWDFCLTLHFIDTSGSFTSREMICVYVCNKTKVQVVGSAHYPVDQWSGNL